MSTNDKNSRPDTFSADYRGSFPNGGQGGRPRRQAQPAAERPAAKQPTTAGQPVAKQSAAKRPTAGQPAAKRPAPPPEKPSAARPGRLENDTEIDDFLPAGDSMDDERLLTKWDDGLEPQEPEKPRARRRGRRRYGILVGSLVLILALVGVGFLATTIGLKIHSALTDDTKNRAYDKFLTVVVAQDPQPFSSPAKADPDFVLNASLWQTMTSDSAANYTEYDDAGRTIVPLGDVVDACHELFGPDCQLQPKNPTEETFYEYDSSKAQFHVALYSLDSTYVPYTEEIKRKDDSTVLRVGYVPPSDDTRVQSGASSGTPKPVKYMEYVLKTDPKTDKEYIYAVNAVTEG